MSLPATDAVCCPRLLASEDLRYGGVLFCHRVTPGFPSRGGEMILAMAASSCQPFGNERARQARRRTRWVMQFGAVDDAAVP